MDDAVKDIIKHLKANGIIDNGLFSGGNGYVYMMGWQLKNEYFEPDFIGLNQKQFDKFWSSIKDNCIYAYFTPEREKGISKVSLKTVKEHVVEYIKEEFGNNNLKDMRDLWYMHSNLRAGKNKL